MYQGGELASKILGNEAFTDEIKAAKTREDCMLVVWKRSRPPSQPQSVLILQRVCVSIRLPPRFLPSLPSLPLPLSPLGVGCLSTLALSPASMASYRSCGRISRVYGPLGSWVRGCVGAWVRGCVWVLNVSGVSQDRLCECECRVCRVGVIVGSISRASCPVSGVSMSQERLALPSAS